VTLIILIILDGEARKKNKKETTVNKASRQIEGHSPGRRQQGTEPEVGEVIAQVDSTPWPHTESIIIIIIIIHQQESLI
jgi:hypothetical protein